MCSALTRRGHLLRGLQEKALATQIAYNSTLVYNFAEEVGGKEAGFSVFSVVGLGLVAGWRLNGVHGVLEF